MRSVLQGFDVETVVSWSWRGRGTLFLQTERAGTCKFDQ